MPEGLAPDPEHGPESLDVAPAIEHGDTLVTEADPRAPEGSMGADDELLSWNGGDEVVAAQAQLREALARGDRDAAIDARHGVVAAAKQEHTEGLQGSANGQNEAAVAETNASDVLPAPDGTVETIKPSPFTDVNVVHANPRGPVEKNYNEAYKEAHRERQQAGQAIRADSREWRQGLEQESQKYRDATIAADQRDTAETLARPVGETDHNATLEVPAKPGPRHSAPGEPDSRLKPDRDPNYAGRHRTTALPAAEGAAIDAHASGAAPGAIDGLSPAAPAEIMPPPLPRREPGASGHAPDPRSGSEPGESMDEAALRKTDEANERLVTYSAAAPEASGAPAELPTRQPGKSDHEYRGAEPNPGDKLTDKQAEQVLAGIGGKPEQSGPSPAAGTGAQLEHPQMPPESTVDLNEPEQPNPPAPEPPGGFVPGDWNNERPKRESRGDKWRRRLGLKPKQR